MLKLKIVLFVSCDSSLFCRDISERFDISRSSAWEYCREVCVALTKFAPIYIKWPTGHNAEQIMAGFYKKKGFMNVIGAIDGTHVEICRPKHNSASYFNRKKRYTIHVQVISDQRQKFIDFFAGKLLPKVSLDSWCPKTFL